MPNTKYLFSPLSSNFREEEKQLISEEITTWHSLRNLSNQKISHLVQNGRSTYLNLQRLRGIAYLVDELSLTQENAALLIHAGISSASALANLTPQELIKRTGRLERQLYRCKKPTIDLKKASTWIKKAQKRQLQK